MMIKYLIWFIVIVGILYILLCIAVFTFQEKLIFHPEKLHREFTFETKYPHEELYFDIGKSSIHALYFKQENPKGCILYFHGNAGSLSSWHDVSERFIELGYDVLIHDYAEYGKSTGKLSNKQLYREADELYAYLKQRYDESDIVIYGRSLGTGIASYLAAKTTPNRLVLETPYKSLGALGKRIYPFLPINQLLKYKLNNARYLKQVDCPVLIFHGTADEVVPYESGKKLEKLLKPDDKFITIEGGFHSNLDAYDAYHRELKAFL